jgi:tRNA(fMet)-specific endonuclease VapC
VLILDTNFLIGFLKGDKKAKAKMEDIDELTTTTAINAFELLYGYHLIEEGRAIGNALGLLNSVGTLPFDIESASIAGSIAAELTAKGKTLEHMDVLIASIALKHGAAILTRNVKHFSRVRKLKVEEW